MKTAIFGGTFDPVHSAHLVIAREAADQLALDQVLFIPAGHPPHKKAETSYEHRYRMVELACAADPRFVASRLEEGDATSYSIETIERVKAGDGVLYFIIGSDAFSEITTWHRWQDVVRSVEFIVVARPGHQIVSPAGARVHRLDTVALPVSSSEIRKALARGESPAEVPPAVAGYIEANRLYANDAIAADRQTVAAESTAVRVALWRALHSQIDSPPHVLEDEIGLRLVAPGDGWRQRPDMDPEGTRGYRAAAIVARARFMEDLVTEQAGRGVAQYVILGAGLDTFAQRRPEIASRLRVFEVDQPGPQAWKRQRLIDLGFGIPEWLRLVPVDFEAAASWWERLAAAGFDANRPAVVASTGVAMYLTRDAIAATLRQIATLAPGSTLAMTFLLPLEFLDPAERLRLQAVQQSARAAGTPFLSFFSPAEMLAMARDAGFAHVRHVSSADYIERYFAGRTDGLRPSSGEAFLVATTDGT
jgi:nicotinate (nicotinamide) nucleotide adenylyltransferase